ncbi:MAG: 2-oxoacid:acceptor oxidoreductase subunit alpha [Thermoplasmata archaeon]|nr:2-oxoacid:acceptor oxidoreductase subunit alpha [Thermoplasmatales archaeon]PMP74845.1 MAG: 2-oxoglutarate synthase subunit alpha [Aciduliprofundum sp.]
MINPGEYFVEGDVAAAYGAIRAGCLFFAGYPITPASEITQAMAELLPRVGGKFLQMEDEIASISAIIGASWAGLKSMTATSGPGFSLMQENIGYAAMTETPIVIIDVQRAGPAIGQASRPAQGDVMQSRFGSHGDYETIVLSPNSVQEMFDLTVKAFNLSEIYRVPVIILSDAEVGHMMERLVVPERIEIVNRKIASNFQETMAYGENLVSAMGRFGDGLELMITGSTHRPDGTRDTGTPEVQENLVRRLVNKIEKNRSSIEEWEELYTEDAEILVISHGASSRPSKGAVIRARKEGIRAGFLRPRVLWPSPERRMIELDSRVKRVILPEMSLRGYRMELERIFHRKVDHLPKVGGVVPTVDEIFTKIRSASL